MKVVNEDPEIVRLMDDFFPKWDPLIAPGSKKSETWTEVKVLESVLKKEPQS
jgi:hypothetical protein